MDNKKHCLLKNKNIIITAGGTGGHIFPALAVADALANQGANITWVGTKNSMEEKIITNKYPILFIKSLGIRGKDIKRKIAFPFQLLSSVISAKKIINDKKADLVIGFGGYVSGPTCLAGKIKNIPVIIHEQNAKIGFTNKILAKFVNKVCFAFEIDNLNKLFTKKQQEKFKIIGNPVRENIIKLNNNENKHFSKDNLNILVLGGSQGSRAINNLIPDIIIKAQNKNISLNIIHQSGKKLLRETNELYIKKNINNENVKPFIDNMDEAYKWADIVICRAGALTVSEIAIAGIVGIFIPLPNAVDNHQYYNAIALVNTKSAICFNQNEVNSQIIFDKIKNFHLNRDLLEQMSNNAKSTLKKDATEQILKIVTEIIK